MRESFRWHRKSLASSVSSIPALPGIYVIVRTNQKFGLETTREFMYVGQTKNMRRRLSEHDYAREQNPSLGEFLRNNRSSASLAIWYTTDPAEPNLDRIERELILDLMPAFNRRTYKKGKSHG